MAEFGVPESRPKRLHSRSFTGIRRRPEKRRHPKMPPSLGRKRPARRHNRVARYNLCPSRSEASRDLCSAQ
jgi:hypothetical protein